MKKSTGKSQSPELQLVKRVNFLRRLLQTVKASEIIVKIPGAPELVEKIRKII